MADSDPRFLSQGLALQLQGLNRRLRRNPPKPPAAEHRRGRPGPIRAILLSDLYSEGSADAAVTILETTNEVQEVAIVGNPVTGGTFTLSFKGQTTGNLNFSARPDQMQTALEGLSTIGKGNVRVTLGLQTYSNVGTSAQTLEFPGVWSVQFIGALAGQTNLPLLIPMPVIGGLQGGPAVMVSETTHWADSGNVETVNAIIPVGTPTPMRAGAVVAAIWFPGIGYGVIACEARQFQVTYYQYY